MSVISDLGDLVAGVVDVAFAPLRRVGAFLRFLIALFGLLIMAAAVLSVCNVEGASKILRIGVVTTLAIILLVGGLAFTTVVVLFGLLPGRLRTSATDWFRIVAGVVATVLCTSLVWYFLPLSGHVGLVPPLLVVSALFVLLGFLGGFRRGVVAIVASVFGVGIIATMFVPNVVPRQMNRLIAAASSADLRQVTKADLEEGTIPFFWPDGRARFSYRRDRNGRVLVYDGEGFDTLTGERLEPVTSDVICELQRQVDATAPKRVFPTQDQIARGEFSFFDFENSPKVWFYKTDEGRYELFDRSGYHPVRGTTLSAVDQTAAAEILKYLRITRDIPETVSTAGRRSGAAITGARAQAAQTATQDELTGSITARFEGVLYSHTQNAWGSGDGGTWSGGGYPNIRGLGFRPGGLLSHNPTAAVSWTGSHRVADDSLVVSIDGLRLPDAGDRTLVEFYGFIDHWKDVSLGYQIELRGATFEDRSLANCLFLFRTFMGDTTPGHIEKTIPIIPISSQLEVDGGLEGEWTGTYKFGERDIGVVMRLWIEDGALNGVAMDYDGTTRTRSTIFGYAPAGYVTLLKRYASGPAVSLVSDLLDATAMTGTWHKLRESGTWRLGRTGSLSADRESFPPTPYGVTNR